MPPASSSSCRTHWWWWRRRQQHAGVVGERAVVDEDEVRVGGGADVDRQEGEAGGHVEVRDVAPLVADEGRVDVDGHHEGVALVVDAEDAVQAVPERPGEVGAAGVGGARELEGREAAVERLHAAERERVRDAQVPACRRRAARVAGPTGGGGGGGSSR